jgi:hypothetical protein
MLVGVFEDLEIKFLEWNSELKCVKRVREEMVITI